MKNIFKIGAILLCILFFTLPLVQCTQDNSYKASGWELATGSGNLFSQSDSSFPIAFVLLIIPIILLIAAFVSDSFPLLRNISIVGTIVKIICLIYFNSVLNSGEYKGAFELTGFNWLVLGIYIGLVAYGFYCVKTETENYSNQRSTINTNYSTVNKKCRQCNTIFTGGNCPKCGSSLYEEIKSTANNSSFMSRNASVGGDTWYCKKCGETNSISSPTCKGCGVYK